MNITRFILIPLIAILGLAFTACETTKKSHGRKPYYVKAYRPQNPNNVRVKVSLQNQALYVMEGNRVLMATACNVGRASSPTPKGNWTIRNKVQKRRRVSQPGAGYPMGYWCEFYQPAYGIHAGWVHPQPRTAGCIRLHFNVAPKFFALVKVGTPLHIADTQPEDLTVGKNIDRPQDYNDPEFPPHILGTDKIFEVYQGRIFED